MRHTVITTLATLLSVVSTTLSAQEQAPVQPGARVRVSQCHPQSSVSPSIVCERTVGTLVIRSADTVTVQVEDRAAELAFALDSLTRLDLYGGRHRHPWRGAGIGLVAGGVGGAAIAYVMYGMSDCITGHDEGTPCPVYGAGLGAGPGLLFGAIIGAFITTDRWEEVPLNPLRVQPAATLDGRIGLAASVSF